MINIFNQDNKEVAEYFINAGIKFDMIYVDFIYDDLNFYWLGWCYQLLKDSGSIFIQTDYRSVAEVKIEADSFFGKPINWIIYPYDWGGRPKRAFGRIHDDILWYSKTDQYKFYPERVQIPKKTLSAGFNPSGRETKTPTDVWDDIGNFHTMDTERIKLDGRNIHWQKPERLMERLILATTDEGDYIFDPFMGTASLGVVCKKLGRDYAGVELDKTIFNLAEERLDKIEEVC
jgi:site-specific DNA-methyltransferase (adenine-specific)